MSLNFDYLSCEERLDAAIARLDVSLARGKSPVCGPSDVNGTALCSDSVVPGPGVRIPKKSNLDLTGRIVKRGALVSWYGLRFTVAKVRTGTCYPVQPSAAGRFLDCNSVQVVS